MCFLFCRWAAWLLYQHSTAEPAGNALVHHWGRGDYQLKHLKAAFLPNFQKPPS